MVEKFLSIPLEEAILFLLVNLILILLGIILWNYLWIRTYGGEIPYQQMSNESHISYFSSKNFVFVFQELWKRIKELDMKYLTRSIGFEAYVFLLFQRKLISLIFLMTIFSILFSFISILATERENQGGFAKAFQTFLLNNKYLTDFTTIVHLISIALFTFLHFRYFTGIKREAKFLYFDRFDKMSRKKDADWLRCRTLHISGLAPNERNITILQRKLDIFLSKEDGGKVIDVSFIPDYKNLLKLEKKRTEIMEMRNLISREETSCIRKWFFPKVFRTEESIQTELDKLEKKMQELTEDYVMSSGHAFVCFDSLISAYKTLNSFRESTWSKFTLKLKAMVDSFRGIGHNVVSRRQTSTFGKLNEEELDSEIYNNDNKVNILVDQMIEPFDIIWANVGGDRGLFICRRIICNALIVITLIFLTTPASMFSTLKSVDYFSLLEFQWIVKIPYGYLMITYMVPLLILLINLCLICLIDILARFEKNYTHSRYHYSVFGKALLYMLLNLFIIPGLTLTAESLYSIVREKLYSIHELLSMIYLSNSGYFFVALIIQSGTISSVYSLLRMDELLVNSFSPFVAFYKRHFTNTGHQWHRNESDCFQFGYYYAQFLVFYTICLVFSSTVPVITAATFYLFLFRHLVDFISLLMVHGCEIDSSGILVNNILNYSFLPVVFFHLSMFSFFLVKAKYYAAWIVIGIFVISIAYTCYFNSKYILDIYSLHEKLNVYEHMDEAIQYNEINLWRYIIIIYIL